MNEASAEREYTVMRATVRLDLGYEAAISAFEAALGRYDHDVGERLVETRATWDEVCKAIEAMDGPFGLMVMTRLDLGPIASLKGTARQCALYLVGNPLIATQIVDLDIRAALLVPFRVEIYGDEGRGVLEYDLPSSSLRALGNGDIDAVGASLDQKMSDVVVEVIRSGTSWTRP